MTEENIHQVSSKTLISICSVLVSVILGITGYFSSNTLTKLAEIQKDIVSVRLKLTEVQNKMLTEARVRQMIDYRILEYNRIIK